MEGVDVKEFYRLSLSTVQADNCMCWSQDHKVSLITSTALHILEVAPNPSDMSADMSLKRSFIKSPDDVPTKSSDIDVNRLLCLLDQRNAYRLVLDVKLAPNLFDTKPLEPHFIRADWSSAGMYQDERCIVAALTNMGCLKLYVPHLNNWIEVVDISQLWIDHCKSLWSTIEIDYTRSEITKTFAMLQNRTSQLKITAFVWDRSIRDDKSKFTYLGTITHSGFLALWKMPNVSDLACTGTAYNTCLVKTCETNMYNAGVLHWLEWNENEISVIIGDANGFVKIVNFESFDRSDKSHVIKDIWNEKDHLHVSHISSTSFKCKKDERIVAVAKHSHVIVFLITQNGVVSSCFHHTGGLPITGLEVMNDKSFIVSILSGGLFMYSININENSVLSLESKVLTSNIVWNDHKCLGIAKSRNSQLLAIGANLCKMYDHLLIRRPSVIMFCTVSCVEDPLLLLKDNMVGNPQNICLHENWESIEMMRMNKIKLQKIQNSKVLEYSEKVDTFSVVGLQLELWQTRMFVAQPPSSDVVVQNLEACAYVTLLEELILCKHACKLVCSLVKNKSSETDDNNLQILSRLRRWLQAWLNQNKVVGIDKNCETKNIGSNITNNSNLSNKSDQSNETMTTERARNVSTTSCVNMPEGYNVIDCEAASVGSFDDAMSSDSNSSHSVSRNKLPKSLQLQHGRVPSNFLKLNLKLTAELVSNALAVSASMDPLNKEFCVFCEQKIEMVVDWRFAVCPASHRLPRCCHCLCLCVQVPFRLCPVCPAVACHNEGCIKETYCTFCDSLLILDEKFLKPKVSPLSELMSSESEPTGDPSNSVV